MCFEAVIQVAEMNQMFSVMKVCEIRETLVNDLRLSETIYHQ